MTKMELVDDKNVRKKIIFPLSAILHQKRQFLKQICTLEKMYLVTHFLNKFFQISDFNYLVVY